MLNCEPLSPQISWKMVGLCAWKERQCSTVGAWPGVRGKLTEQSGLEHGPVPLQTLAVWCDFGLRRSEPLGYSGHNAALK